MLLGVMDGQDEPELVGSGHGREVMNDFVERQRAHGAATVT